jgi:mRNA interferase YafQ
VLAAKKSPAFDRDVKRCAKKHWGIASLKDAMRAILSSDEEPIPLSYNDHALSGDRRGYRELHVGGRKSDWLVLYRIDGGIAEFVRTGTHDDLFR